VLGHGVSSGESRGADLKSARGMVYLMVVREGGGAVDGAVQRRLYACMPASNCHKQQDAAPEKCSFDGKTACGFVLEVIHYVVLDLIHS
jgi:hypothetical protein